MDELIFRIVELVIIIVITLVARYGIPFLKEILEQSKLSGVMDWIDTAVDAAEQTIKGSGAGAEKKAIVTEFLHQILTSKNLSISDEQLDALIEAAVFAMNKAKEK